MSTALLLLGLACTAHPFSAVCADVPAPVGRALSVVAFNQGQGLPPPAIHYRYRVVASYPHDPTAFTQGLLFADGKLYESTGGYGESSVRVVQLESGRVLRQQPLPASQFGEGLTLVGERLFQLTWRVGIGYVRDATTLASVQEFQYSGEGWGLAFYDGKLALSDGTAVLRFLDPNNFAVHRTIRVRDENGPVERLNELEMVEDELYANVWPTNRIAIIDPATGIVRGWLDLAGILPLVFRRPETDVLNGIAYESKTQRLFVTGKRWARLFEIEVVPK